MIQPARTSSTSSRTPSGRRPVTTPGRTMLFAAAAVAVLLVSAVVVPDVILAAVAANVALAAWWMIEQYRLRRAHVHVERLGWDRLEIQRPTSLEYRVENRGGRAVTVGVRQIWPGSIDADAPEAELRIEPGEAVRAAVQVTARERGVFDIPPLQVTVRFNTDMARLRYDLDDPLAMTVYPDLRAIAAYETLRRHHALGRFGIHRIRMQGAGREFDQLREYVPDDDYRDINWKATARHRKPITNIYRAERSQDLLICLDCGRMMGNPLDQGTVLDRAVNTAMVLSHVCVRSGDRPGLVLFKDSVTSYLKPAAGTPAVTRIMGELVGATPEGVFPSYAELMAAIRRNQSHRAMVFLFTDLNDPQLAVNLTQVLPLVSRRHVVVVVSLRDGMLDQLATGAPRDVAGLHQVLAARSLADEREARVRDLVRAGVQVLESDAQSLSLDVINRYLAIKLRQMV